MAIDPISNSTPSRHVQTISKGNPLFRFHQGNISDTGVHTHRQGLYPADSLFSHQTVFWTVDPINTTAVQTIHLTAVQITLTHVSLSCSIDRFTSAIARHRLYRHVKIGGCLVADPNTRWLPTALIFLRPLPRHLNRWTRPLNCDVRTKLRIMALTEGFFTPK